MSLKSQNPTKTTSWIQTLRNQRSHMKTWFKENPNRAEEFTIKWEDFYVDFSKNRITSETLELFKELDLKNAIEQQFKGEKINETENRAVLHTAVRSDVTLKLDGADIKTQIKSTKNKIKVFSDSITFRFKKRLY